MTDGNSTKVLVIDDDDTFVAVVEDVLTEEGYEVLTALRGEDGMDILYKNEDTKVLLLDLCMPGLPGEQVLRKLKDKGAPDYKEMPVVIVLTADRDVHKEEEMLKAGAANFIVKPLTANELIAAVKDVITTSQDYIEVGWTIPHRSGSDIDQERKTAPYNPKERNALQGKSDAMLALQKEIFRVAQTDSTVLLLGETGVGKELVAKAIHESSRRQDKPFIVVDCAGLPSYELIYSELWGHEKGAFTGAVSRREGRVRQADGGTIFLDEIGTLDNRMQAHLLPFCQTKKFQPLGSNESYKIDARIIAATNLDVKEAVENGHFRSDLYYRLTQSILKIPPLRERRQVAKADKPLETRDPIPIFDDIEILVDYAIDRYNKTNDRTPEVRGIDVAALKLLKEYDWPGNVRQLNNVIAEAASRASVRALNRVITKEDVENSRLLGTTPALKTPPSSSLTDLYQAMQTGDQRDARRFADKVSETLNMAGGNISRASGLAQVSRVTMYKYIKEAREINLRS